MLPWEAVTALGTVLSALVILATVVAAARQIRLASVHVEQLRRATQLEGTMQLFDKLEQPKFLDAFHFIRDQLASRMKDPAFVAQIIVGGEDESVHKELIFLRTMERIGSLIGHGLLDGEIIYDECGYFIAHWELLADVVEFHRKRLGRGVWRHYETLYDDMMRWAQRERPEWSVGPTRPFFKTVEWAHVPPEPPVPS